MTDYDALFAETAPADSVFEAKAALDPLAEPEEVIARSDQQRELARILNGVQEGYLPPTVSIYGPPGTGKTLTTRRVTTAFATRHDDVAVEYVNLKECRSLFSAANEIHLALTGERKGAYAGLDGVFDGIWRALEAYPEWTVLVLDEIDHIQQDTNYDPNDFFYRLLRGEGKLARDIHLSAWLVSNELLEVDLRLDSRVESAMSNVEIFFPPYDAEALDALVAPQCDRAFRSGALPPAVRRYGVEAAARRWGDARKTLRLFRQAGELATDRGLDAVTRECVTTSLAETDHETIQRKIEQLPANHVAVLSAAVSRRQGEQIVQPVTTTYIHDRLNQPSTREAFQLGTRRIRELVTDLETMGLVETWIEAGQSGTGRVKYLETTFDPAVVREAQAAVAQSLQDAADE